MTVEWSTAQSNSTQHQCPLRTRTVQDHYGHINAMKHKNGNENGERTTHVHKSFIIQIVEKLRFFALLALFFH